MNTTAQITVNEPGARTLRDTRPMLISGQQVHVTVGGGTASLIVGGQVVAERAMDDLTTTQAQVWAAEYRAQMEADRADHAEATYTDPAEVDWDVVEEACDLEEVYAAAAQQVRSSASALLDQAGKLSAHGEGPYRYRSTVGRGRVVTLTADDPRHPARAAEYLRREAARLMAWTAKDEAGYKRYVSDGLADTNGYFAPESRYQWAATFAPAGTRATVWGVVAVKP